MNPQHRASSGPESFFLNVLVDRPKKAARAHDGKFGARRVRVREEERWSHVGAYACGNTTCALCYALDRARVGPLCGWTSPEGARCIFAWGHAHPGDHALCGAWTYDHNCLAAQHVPTLVQLVGRDPFPHAASATWVREGPLGWGDARLPAVRT